MNGTPPQLLMSSHSSRLPGRPALPHPGRLAIRAALDTLTPEKDGVDGAAVYLYGEAWDFGEVALNARGRNASQLNMGGTRIGAFNDRCGRRCRAAALLGLSASSGHRKPGCFTNRMRIWRLFLAMKVHTVLSHIVCKERLAHALSQTAVAPH